jgi:hypothetical protein
MGDEVCLAVGVAHTTVQQDEQEQTHASARLGHTTMVFEYMDWPDLEGAPIWLLS